MVNGVTIDKHITIVRLLEKLDLQRHGWTIYDSWKSDLCAVGLTSHAYPDRLVYVSTWRQPIDRYYYECEQKKPDVKDEGDYEVVGLDDEVRYDELFKVIQKHLGC